LKFKNCKFTNQTYISNLMQLELIDIKIKLYQKCVEKQTEIVESSFNAMEDVQKAANEYGPPKDRYDSFRAQLLRKRDLHAEQYEKALKELDYLQKLNPELRNSRININTLIITDKQKLYISIGLGKIEIPEGTYYVISPLAPIYQTLKEKTTGEKVVFNGQQILIIDLV